MEFEARLPSPLALPSPPVAQLECRDCGCSCSLSTGASSGSWFRSVKRKYDEFESSNRFFIPGLDLVLNPRVQIENECAALREVVTSQQQAIRDLHVELEQERSAASSAANEAMSMILRLQREKAEVQMEARQFKRFAEEKMAHDFQEVSALEEVLYKREQAIQSLTCEVQAYKHRMLSFGFSEADIDGEQPVFSRVTSMNDNLEADKFEFPVYDYPPLKCSVNENPSHMEEEDNIDIEKYAFGETPRGKESLKNLEYRICQMEKSPRSYHIDGEFYGAKNVAEKVIIGQSPRRARHNRRFSADSSNSLFGAGRNLESEAMESPSTKLSSSLKKTQYFTHTDDASRMEYTSDFGDDMTDRVYTIDSVYSGNAAKPGGIAEDPSDAEIKKLYSRLQALEADRESMRLAILSMRTDKAQLVLLKEIAQQLCKDISPAKQISNKKRSIIGSFSLISVIKWIVSFAFWRKRARENKCVYDISSRSAGLLMLLEKNPRAKKWRCLSRTQV